MNAPSPAILAAQSLPTRRTLLSALGLLLLLNLALFAPFLTGNRCFIGNPDRFNVYLPFLHATGASQTALGDGASWDPTLFGGWNTLGLAGCFPLGYESWIYHPDLVIFLYRASLLAFAYFILCGLSAFLFLQGLYRRPWISLIGALLYQCAFASILRLTQSDQTFAVLVLGPFLLWAARRAVTDRSNQALVFLIVGCAWLVWFTFLQEAAYMALLLGSYLVFSTVNWRAWRRGTIAAGCAAAGLALGIPRVLLVGRELGLNIRIGGDLPFRKLFEFQNIRPWEILRFFDDTVLGRNHQEAGLSNLNFSEGLQLFTAQITPFLLLWLLAQRSTAAHSRTPTSRELKFFGIFLVGTIAVICIKPIYWLVYLLFGKIDFYHTRIMVAGLPPLVALVGAALVRLHARAAPPPGIPLRHAFGAIAAGIGAALAVHLLTSLVSPTDYLLLPGGRWHWVADPNLVLHIRWQALVAVSLSALITFASFWAARRRAGPPYFATAAIFLGVMTAAQAMMSAHYQLSGPHTSNLIPFASGNSWHPFRRDFHSPTPEERNRLRSILEQPIYRSAIVQSDDAAGSLLANSIASFYGIDVIDGYLSGVPRNLAWLPWGANVLRLRQIHFSRTDDLPWRTFALTGVKHVWEVDRHVFTKDPNRFAASKFLSNPLPVVPRIFFPQQLIAAPSNHSCEEWMLHGSNGLRINVESTSIVCAPAVPVAGGSATDIRSTEFQPGQIKLTLRSTATDRFVVLNERWHPGWSAKANAHDIRIYETNGFMMGIPIPAHTTSVILRFNGIAWALSRTPTNSP